MPHFLGAMEQEGRVGDARAVPSKLLLLPACGEKAGMRGRANRLRLSAVPLPETLRIPTSPHAAGERPCAPRRVRPRHGRSARIVPSGPAFGSLVQIRLDLAPALDRLARAPIKS